MMTSVAIRQRAGDRGFSLIELMIAMGITLVVMAVTMAGLSDALRANDMVVNVTTMNNGLRLGMDLMIRDLLQTGSGLGKGHVVQIPSGGSLIRRPGPPGTAYTRPATELAMPAVIPGAGLGPTINGVATDIITILTADNNFTDIPLAAVGTNYVDVTTATNIGTGVDRVIAGQLLMVSKGAVTTMVEVTSVNAATRRISFDINDSLSLNQAGTGIVGSMATLNAISPSAATSAAAAAAATRVTRVRMISYYLDNITTPGAPRLVRRINNGHPMTFNNLLGTAVALDIENLQFSYDINDGSGNPGNVEFVAADLTTAGRCNPVACSVTQIRKINVMMTARSQNYNGKSQVYRNTLNSQVALRGMALVNDYQ